MEGVLKIHLAANSALPTGETRATLFINGKTAGKLVATHDEMTWLGLVLRYGVTALSLPQDTNELVYQETGTFHPDPENNPLRLPPS
jgi:hypothetical protein